MSSASVAAKPSPTTAITPGADGHEKLAPLASRFVDVDALPWRASRYEGIETKTLLVDSASGLLTMLMRMSPGARLPDHRHMDIEQTWVIEGSLDCHEGQCTAGNFVWRPAGSRHDAWAGANGAVLLGSFQLPNKFFEANGSEVDFLGADWDSQWGAVNAKRAQATSV